MRIINKSNTFESIRRVAIIFSIHFVCVMLFVSIAYPIDKSMGPPRNLLSKCDNTLSLFGIAPEQTIYDKDTGFSMHFKHHDKYPSLKSYKYLEGQLIKCGWKHYKKLLNDKSWVSYLKGDDSSKADVIHRYGRTFVDERNNRIAVVIITYVSKPNSMKEAVKLSVPDNDIQNIVVQISPFNERDFEGKR
ncbi:MAG: hypothetical protein Kow00128_22780 [Deltaproteobacteria bacterium]